MSTLANVIGTAHAFVGLIYRFRYIPGSKVTARNNCLQTQDDSASAQSIKLFMVTRSRKLRAREAMIKCCYISEQDLINCCHIISE